MRQFAQLQLTCTDTDEATRIADALLAERLIVCAKQLPVESKSLWKGGVEKASEVMLLMDSAEDLFFAVEAEVEKLHSYETFVLQMLPLIGLSVGAASWMNDNLRPKN